IASAQLAALALGLLLGVPGLARADVKFTFTTIDVPNSTGTEANANSPNAIAGEFDDASGSHAFVLRLGAFKTFDVPGAIGFSTVNGINASGQLAGTYQGTTSQGTTRLFAYFLSSSKDPFITLDPPGSIRSLGGFINAQGQVVGTFRTSDQVRHG